MSFEFGRKILNELEVLALNEQEIIFLKQYFKILENLFFNKKEKFNRVLPLGELFVDRWEKAELLGFAEGSSIYDSAVVLGNVKVGKHTWIGPNVILDGSGGLEIGEYCSVSAGVQIYTHDSVNWAISGGKKPYEYARTKISDHCYIGPNTIIQRGVEVGKGCIIGANSFVNRDIPPNCKAYGNPVIIKEIE